MEPHHHKLDYAALCNGMLKVFLGGSKPWVVCLGTLPALS